jgi:hypothetical protein
MMAAIDTSFELKKITLGRLVFQKMIQTIFNVRTSQLIGFFMTGTRISK